MTLSAAPSRVTVARILNPRTVAVFGASDDRGKWAGRIMHYLALHGFEGEIVPINPRRDIVRGKTCYPRIGDAPPVDVAIVAIPATKVPETLRECAAAGVGCCIVISSGFGEAGGDGPALQEEAIAIARASGMRLIGPNCLGLVNVLNGMAMTSARVLDVERLIKGEIGLVSQSGALMLSLFDRANDAGIGLSQFISVGNQADLELCDFFEHMIEDDATKVICLHIEGLNDGQRFRDLARRARRQGKPVVAIKTGRSAQGGEAARSHTASLAGAYPVFAALCRETGIVLVDDADVMILTAHMLARFGACPPGGVGVVSSSGGINGIIADRLADIGAPLAKLGDAAKQRLAEVMLQTHLENPIDLGARRQEFGEGNAIAERVVQAVASDPDVGIVMIPLTTAPNYEAATTALAKPLAVCGKPGFFIVTPGSVATPIRAIIKAHGCPLYDRIDDGMRMLNAYRSYTPPTAAEIAAKPPRPARSFDLEPGYLTEPETKSLLAGYGIPVTRERIVRSVDEALSAAAAIGFPVVLKAVTSRVVHKSDAGLVKLGLGDEAAVARAYDELMAALQHLDPEGTVVVAEMVSGALELILGVKHDPQFGPTVMVGAGGVLVELLGDVELALAPIDHAAAEAMLRRLRVAPLLTGFRGRPALDVAAAADALSRLSALAADLGPRLAELDINPLIVREAGQGVVAVDGRAVIR